MGEPLDRKEGRVEERGVAIVGAGGHARVVLDALRSCGVAVWGCVDDNPALHGQALDGTMIRGALSELVAQRDAIAGVVVAIGNNADRMRLVDTVKRWGFQLATAVHRTAVVAETATVGSGSVLMAGVILQPGAQLGEATIVNTSASVDHDCVIEDGAHLAPGVHPAGSVHVGRGSMLGIGVVALPCVSVGADCVIGAGSVITRDIQDGVLAYGCPARSRTPK